MTAKQKTILIGLDGVDPRMFRRFAEDGTMPTVHSMIESGVFGSLKSIFPILTPPAWTCAVTGVNPGKHGIFGFCRPRKVISKRDWATSVQRKAPALWNILNAMNKKAAVINVPVTYPPEKIDGYMISGAFAPSPSPKIIHPRELWNELTMSIGEYKGPLFPFSFTEPQVFFDALIETAEYRLNTVRYILTHKNVDFLMVGFMGTDFVQHFFWGTKINESGELEKISQGVSPQISKFFGVIDTILQAILEVGKEKGFTNYFIFSDHGAEAGKRLFFGNEWLSQRNLLKKRSKSFVSKLLQSLGITYPNLARLLEITRSDWVRDYLPGILKERVPGHLSDLGIFSSAKAIFIEDSALYLNKNSRFQDGVLTNKEAEFLEDEIAKELSALVDPRTGVHPIRRVVRPFEIYWGGFVSEAPDLITIQHPNYRLVERFRDFRRGKDASPFEDVDYLDFTRHNSFHGEYGIFMAVGDDISRKIEVNAHITDIAPTILYSLGLPTLKSMDGRVIEECFSERYRRLHEIHKIEWKTLLQGAQGLSEQEEKEIEERLRRLGYFG